MKANHPLLKTAQNQSGLFTSQQAVSAGMDSRNHSYHLKAGNWSKEGKGIYKLNLIQEDSRKKFFFFQLLMRSKRGELVGTFSYETALYLMGFKIRVPDLLQITVPIHFRKNVSKHKIVIHHENLNSYERIKKNNLYITSVEKTFQDLLLNNTVYHPEWVKQQFKKAIEQNVISVKELKNVRPSKKMNDKEKNIFNAVLFELLS